FTPISSETNSGRNTGSRGSSTSITSRDVKPLTPRFATRSRPRAAGPPGPEAAPRRRTSWFGQRSASPTEVPIVSESPSATNRSGVMLRILGHRQEEAQHGHGGGRAPDADREHREVVRPNDGRVARSRARAGSREARRNRGVAQERARDEPRQCESGGP